MSFSEFFACHPSAQPYRHAYRTMKTTLELADDLMIQARATAAKRHTTLKAMFESALRRKIDYKLPHSGKSEIFTTHEYGFPVINSGRTPSPLLITPPFPLPNISRISICWP